MMFKSIRSRLTLWYAVVLGIIFLVSDMILYQGFKMSLNETMNNTLHTAAADVENAIFKLPVEKWQATIKQMERGFLVNRLFIQVLEVSTTGKESLKTAARSGVLAVNISQQGVWQRLSRHFPSKPVYMNVNLGSPGSHPLRIILYPVKFGDGKEYLIQVGTSLIKILKILKNFLMILMVSAPVLLLVSVLGGFLILTKALQPVKSVVHTAQKITAEDLSLRIDSRNRKDEIGLLINTFNRMISRLERSVLQIKQFSGDASHDLRTPLTVIRGEIEIALRKKRSTKEYIKTLSSVQEEATKLEKVIDNLLFLSRMDSSDYRQSFSLGSLDEILLQVFEKTESLANKKGVAYVIERMESIRLQCDPILVNRLIMNLLDNAIKYTPQGGRVEISLTKTGEKAILTIRDTGIGIPGKDLTSIFNRFYRVDRSRTRQSEGAGLGLSIVKKIADIHHAEVEIKSQPNKGTTVCVRIPLS